ncbi:MAG: DNA-3-methyladenine glycosylase [Phaeodactylibacter sp.]|uniref:DNA-3-methyladenine glycosylase n=1 Tax=Phaeodactylibacter sp. TaxID=1940289 RepID=UPI0032EB1C32
MPDTQKRIPRSFFTRSDVLQVSRDLLGQYLVTEVDGIRTAGRIVETEAYHQDGDKACHAYRGRRTNRTEVMFCTGGHAYVYLCYGIHHLFNIVTGSADVGSAVLIRALEPVNGTGLMLGRRRMGKVEKRLTAGPGVLSQAMGITTDWTGLDLTTPQSPIWLEYGAPLPASAIKESPRIGVDYAGECAQWPWRFTVKNSKWLSR